MKKIILLTLGMLALSARIYAQLPVNEAPPIEAPPYEISPNPSVVYPEEILQPDVIHATVYDPPPVAVTYSPNVFEELRANSLPGSFSQQAAWSLHNNFGFSLGAQEGYYFSEYPDESYYRVFGGKRSSSATSLSASVFTNYARGKSAIHLDYGANYSFYPQRRNTADDIIHSTSAAYIYRINDRARFQLRNQLTSSSNDPLADMFSVNSSSDRLMMGSYYFDALLTT
ncbi:MAG: hypothetical protein LBJ21_04160, partial [Acidobacteriota bacterium]|nr:hypothetical protein [Acidobacteriota bacterium]